MFKKFTYIVMHNTNIYDICILGGNGGGEYFTVPAVLQLGEKTSFPSLNIISHPCSIWIKTLRGSVLVRNIAIQRDGKVEGLRCGT